MLALRDGYGPGGVNGRKKKSLAEPTTPAGDIADLTPMHKHKLQPKHPLYVRGLRVLAHGHFVDDDFYPDWTHAHPGADAYTHPARLRWPTR